MRVIFTRVALAAALTLSIASARQPALAATFTLNPVADAFVTAAHPDSNYGAAGGLAVSAPQLPNGEFQSVLRFDLQAAKASFDATYGVGQWTLQSITLRLSATSPNNPIFN